MTSVLTYGSYTHADNEVIIRSITKSKEFGPRGFATEIVETWTLEGMLQASSVSALTTAMAALETAYATPGQDLKFYIDSGLTRHYMLRSGTLGGPIPTALTWVSPFDAEYTTFRSYQLTVVARFPQVEQELVDYHEQLQSSGGLPEYKVQRLRNGSPIVQPISPMTEYRAVQTGMAIGYSRYPVPPPPIFGTASPPLKDAGTSRESPEIWRGGRRNYRISWQYVFEATFPLNALPNIR